MRILFETALCLALAAAIVFLLLVPLHRHRPLPDRLGLMNLTFVFLAICPIGAAIVTAGLIVLFGSLTLVLMSIGWLGSYDLLAGAKVAFFDYAPLFAQGARSWHVLIATYALILMALLARGIRVLIRHGRQSSG